MQAGETSGAARPSGPEGSSAPGGRSAIYSVELEVFEGPLDLLLHLVRRHELEILDIPIAFITEKYLAYLDFMRSLDLEIAGDYLVMAATLAWLKSRELLPTLVAPAEAGGEDEEDGEDPREALIRRLVEYERFKNAAADLDALPVSGRDVFARGADIDIPPIDPGLAPVTLFKLAEAYYRVLTRAKIAKSHEVQLEPVTVAQRMTQLTLLLDQRQAFDFEGLFLGRTWNSEKELRGMLVVTLMSVLELVKLGVARVQQVADSESIRVYRLEVSDETRALLDAYDEEKSFGDDGKPRPPPPPIPSDAELDEAEESILLAEALAGADDADLGPAAGTSPAANSEPGEAEAAEEGSPEDELEADAEDPEARDDTLAADSEEDDGDGSEETDAALTTDADEAAENTNDALAADAEEDSAEEPDDAATADADADAAGEDRADEANAAPTADAEADDSEEEIADEATEASRTPVAETTAVAIDAVTANDATDDATSMSTDEDAVDAPADDHAADASNDANPSAENVDAPENADAPEPAEEPEPPADAPTDMSNAAESVPPSEPESPADAHTVEPAQEDEA
ncbi:MAG: segregation/condensation protein A [Myxococcales bacterium]|nr:segregation/condensation protein A [Myxococcales bacterium]